MIASKLRLIEKRDLYKWGRLWELRFEAPGLVFQPGQFVNISVDGRFLRRPISVSDHENEILSFIIQPIGEGTQKIINTPIGTSLDMLLPLGNCFSIPDTDEPKTILLAGGGVGYAPLVGLMRKLSAKTNIKVYAFFGFNTEKDIPLNHIIELKEKGYQVEISTLSGEIGYKGNVGEMIQEKIELNNLTPSYFYTCGPLPMMTAISQILQIEGELSLEARMGCGFGACVGCTIKTKEGNRRICKEGPVFKNSELWI